MFALDTNTVSDYFRGDPQVVPKLQALPPSQVGIPSLVAYELRNGLLRLPETAARRRRQALEQFLAAVHRFDFNEPASTLAANIRASLEREGAPIGPHDVLIAATAMAHGATLVTRNVREFCRIEGLILQNWHTDSPQP